MTTLLNILNTSALVIGWVVLAAACVLVAFAAWDSIVHRKHPRNCVPEPSDFSETSDNPLNPDPYK